jgi:hypothetical protein
MTLRQTIREAARLLNQAAREIEPEERVAAIVLENLATMALNVESRIRVPDAAPSNAATKFIHDWNKQTASESPSSSTQVSGPDQREKKQ